MKLFDTHCHYEDTQFDEDRWQRLDELRNTDIKILNCCSDESVFDTVMEISSRYDFAYCSIGIHPHWCMSASEIYLDKIAKLAENPKVRAIGEMGLDYYFDEPEEIQKRVFRQQLELAAELDKPVIIHDRLAHEDVMEILRKYRPKGILHRYGGPLELLQEANSWGMYMSINNDISHPGWKTRHADILLGVSLDRLLVETDAPYSPPFGSENRRSEAADVSCVIKEIAKARNIDIEQLSNILYENALQAYGF